MDGYTILTWIIVGLIAGVLASMVVGWGYGVIGDIIVGIVGAFLGGWLFRAVGWSYPFGGWLGVVTVAFIGACVLLLVLRVIHGGYRRGI